MEKLQTVLSSLPHMSQDIVDDTIHEKILSYLSEYVARGPDMIAKFMEWNVLDIIRACTSTLSSSPLADYRITALAIRFFARILLNDDKLSPKVFPHLLNCFPDVLEFILWNAGNAEEALLRNSCVEALQAVVEYDEGAMWFLKTGKSGGVVSKCFEDSSNYVISATSKLLLSIINHSIPPLSPATQFQPPSTRNAQSILLDSLILSLDLFNKFRETLYNARLDSGKRMAVLEFVWTLANSRTRNAVKFLIMGKLLMRIDALLRDANRLIRSRANEILSITLEWVPNPISLFTESAISDEIQEHEQISKAFNYILYQIAIPLLNPGNDFEMVITAVNVFDSLTKFAERARSNEISTRLAYTIMNLLIFLLDFATAPSSQQYGITKIHNDPGTRNCDAVKLLYENGVAEKLSALLKTGKKANIYRKLLVLSVLHAIKSVAIKFSQVIENVTLVEVILVILFTPAYNTDQRILKAGLDIIPLAFHTKVVNGQITDHEIMNKTLDVVIRLLKDPNTECRGVTQVLETVESLLRIEVIGQLILNSADGLQLAETLRVKTSDVRWEVRDSVVEFIGRLCKEGNESERCVEFVLKFDLIATILKRIKDPETYVRASSVNSMRNIIRRTEGWNYILSNNLKEEFVSQLPFMMKDTEAFVRRAVMDLMICLFVERGCGAILLADQNAEIMNPEVMMKIMDDPDFEVRIRGCQFLAVIWDHCEQDRMQGHKKRKREGVTNDNMLIGEDSSWFYWLHGDKILIDSTEDPSRLVRHEILIILNRLKPYLAKIASPSIDNSINSVQHDSSTTSSLSLPYKRQTNESELLLLQKHTEFYQQICTRVNFDRLSTTIDSEYLYSEALESVDASIMKMMDVEFIIGGGGDDDDMGDLINNIDCY